VNPNPGNSPIHLAAWHRNLLTAAAVFTVLLIGVGGILCVTQSIRSCPDWPGCFGKPYPPLETSPILEYTHRLLAASSGLLILASAIAGLARARRLRWILIPPLVALVLLVEVSYFGAKVVLIGLSRAEAAIDVGSALLVVALMGTAAGFAHARRFQPDLPDRLAFRSLFSRLALAALVVVYGVLASAVLVAGPGSVTGCLGWPLYSPAVFQADSLGAGNVLRLLASLAGIGLLIALLVQALRAGRQRPAIRRSARLLLAVVLLEAVLQILLLVFGFETGLLIAYTVTMAILWGLLVALTVGAGLGAERG